MCWEPDQLAAICLLNSCAQAGSDLVQIRRSAHTWEAAPDWRCTTRLMTWLWLSRSAHLRGHNRLALVVLLAVMRDADGLDSVPVYFPVALCRSLLRCLQCSTRLIKLPHIKCQDRRWYRSCHYAVPINLAVALGAGGCSAACPFQHLPD